MYFLHFSAFSELSARRASMCFAGVYVCCREEQGWAPGLCPDQDPLSHGSQLRGGQGRA